jgi:hypothetical protein
MPACAHHLSGPDVVVTPLDIQLGKDCGLLELVNKVLDAWEWIPVFDSYSIKLSVIMT